MCCKADKLEEFVEDMCASNEFQIKINMRHIFKKKI